MDWLDNTTVHSCPFCEDWQVEYVQKVTYDWLSPAACSVPGDLTVIVHQMLKEFQGALDGVLREHVAICPGLPKHRNQ